MSNVAQLVLSQSVYASLAHRYWNSDWSAAKNASIYGRDASFEGLGGDFRLELHLRSKAADGEAALDAPLSRLKARLDHRCLFDPGAPFHDRASTLENITDYLATELFAQPVVGEWIGLTLHESNALACTVDRQGLRLHLRSFNLLLTCAGRVDPASGLLLARQPVLEAVRATFFKQNEAQVPRDVFATALFSSLKEQIPLLVALRIDLGRHEFLTVHSKS